MGPFPTLHLSLPTSIKCTHEQHPHGPLRRRGMPQHLQRPSRGRCEKDGQLSGPFGTFVRNEQQTSGDVRELRKACRKDGLRFTRYGMKRVC